MESIQLSKRLELVSLYIQPGARLADIGSDHAYLPCALAQKNLIEWAVAGEVVKGPYNKAKQEVSYRKLENQIEVRFGDGLEVIHSDDRIDTITICGMGGALIRDILQRGINNKILSRKEKLILQPNVGEKTLRTFLMNNHYKIINEEILAENDKIYEIIVAIPTDETIQYSELELTFGPVLLMNSSSIFKLKWSRELEKLLYIKEELKKSKEVDSVKENRLNQEINQIMEMIK